MHGSVWINIDQRYVTSASWRKKYFKLYNNRLYNSKKMIALRMYFDQI